MSPRYLSADAENVIRLTIELEPYTHPMTAMEYLLTEDLSRTAVCTDVGVLLRSVAKFFSVEVLVSLEQTLEMWEIQSLPEITMFHAAQHIFQTFVVRSATEGSAGSTGSTGSRSTGQSVSTSDGSSATPSSANSGIGGRPCCSTNESLDGSEQNDTPEDQSTDNSTTKNSPLPGDGFRNATRRTVKTESGSPPRTKHSTSSTLRQNIICSPIIHKAALHFDTAFHQSSNLPAAFGDTTLSIAVLYHVTRAHYLPSFFLFRREFKPSELHHRSAFYLSNIEANGASHVLHYKFHPQNNPDPLLVFSFAVNPKIILGKQPYTKNLYFKTRIIEVPVNPLNVGYTTRYQEFCKFVKKNWTQSWSEEECEELEKFDFVVSPVCERPSDNSVGITHSLKNSGPQLMQVAACSGAAQAYLNSTIVEIVHEDCQPYRPPPQASP
ncbi:hypothetical protein GGX14DRAFT_411377 [Mycena pura]|uniref:Uncharacterized protein n=1 Tax=Mycena pura TaxID=153505 RepID=A0AAD6YVV0_9AGAR|nr:hypothetical protein GGX14DRAFT_411377 [Mycena pura]